MEVRHAENVARYSARCAGPARPLRPGRRPSSPAAAVVFAMIDLPAVFGLLGGLLGVASTIPYVRDTLRRTSVPHRGTWLIWSVLEVVAAQAQWADGAGWSLLPLFTQAAGTWLVFALSVRLGCGGLGRGDLTLMAMAGVGVAGWLAFDEPVIATICVIIADFAAAVMMAPKAWRQPHSETLSTFVLAAVGGALMVGSVGSGRIALLAYPIYYTLIDAALAAMIAYRRRCAGVDRLRRSGSSNALRSPAAQAQEPAGIGRPAAPFLPVPPSRRFVMPETSLQTGRLTLTPLGPSDRAAFVAYRRVPAVARWQSWGTNYSEDDADQLIAAQPSTELPAPGKWLQLAVHHRDAGTLAGDVAVYTWQDQVDTYELGVTIAPTWQRQGIGGEAVNRVVDWLLGDHGAHRLVASCDARNEPIARLLRGSGFRHEGRNLDSDLFKGEWSSVDTYALLAGERAAIS